MRGHAKERRATVLFFLSVARHAVLAEAKWGVLCQDRESKLHDQVAELEACVAQLQFSVIQTTELAAPSKLVCKYSISEPHLHPVRCTSLLL
jgi:hypothetical protein